MKMNFLNTKSQIYWLWIPVLAMIAQIILELSFPADVLAHLHGEEGPHEFLQALLMALAFIVSLDILRRLSPAKDKFLFGWVSLAALGTFYVTGEEISWGQHIFDWTASEYWQEVNDQQETNLHNTSSWLDQKPRLVLEIGVIVGGIIFPILQKCKPAALPEKFKTIYPPAHLIVIAVIFLALKLIDKADSFGFEPFQRISEIQELYIFYFVFLYLITLRRRVISQQ